MAADRLSAYRAARTGDLAASEGPRGAELRVIETSDLGALDRAAWGALVASAPDGTVFQSLDWLLAWWQAFGGRGQPLVVLAYRGCELVGAAPLFIDDTSGRTCIRFIGANHADYLIFPARDGAAEVVERLLDHLERGYGTRYDLHLVDVPDTSTLGWVLQQRQRRIPLRMLRTEATPCPRLKIRDNDRQLREVLNKKSLKRHTAKLAAQGTVVVQHLSDAREILARLEQFFEQHRRRWAVTPFPSLFEAEEDCRFYRNLVGSGLCNGSLMFTTVSVGGRLAACHFGFVSRADFIWYKPSFEVTLSRFSPGEVLLRELLLLARERGFEYFDFTRGDEAFKSRFSSEVRYNSSYAIYASRVDALLARTRRFVHGALQWGLSPRSSTGQFLRQLKRTFASARGAGAGSTTATLASFQLAGDTWLSWLSSRRTVQLFSAQELPLPEAERSDRVREANLEYLLEGSGRLAEVLAVDKHFLAQAHKRLAHGERCFVIEDREQVTAVAWASPRSPHPLSEVEAELRFPGQAVVLYDFRLAQNYPRPGLYLQLLIGIRSALGAAHALTYSVDSNAALLEAIRRAGFAPEGVIENRILAGRRRLTSRPCRPEAICWQIQRSTAN